MTSHNRVTGVLWLSAGGFLAIIVLCWLNEMFTPFGETTEESFNLLEALSETAIIAAVAAPSLFLLRRSLDRLHNLENLLSVCAWCKKVEHDGEWIPLSQYFKLKFRTETTHGICTSCLDEEEKALAQRRELKNSPVADETPPSL